MKGPFARALKPSSQARTYNKNRHNVTDKEKDRLWIKANPLSEASKNYTTKLAPRWIAPYHIVDWASELPSQALRVVNVCDLKKCNPTSAEMEAQEREAVIVTVVMWMTFWGFHEIVLTVRPCANTRCFLSWGLAVPFIGTGS